MSDVKYITDFDVKRVKGISYSASLGSLSYSAGTSGSVSTSMSTSVSAGASLSISTGVGGSFTLYDAKFSEQRYGGSSGLGEAHQKTYIDTFSIAVGSQDPLMVRKNKILTILALTSTLVLIFSGAKSFDFRDNSEDGNIPNDVSEIQGTVTLSILNIVNVCAAALAIIARRRKVRKIFESVDGSKATLGISKNARAFLGVQSDDVASGLSFHEGNFELSSIGSKNQKGAFSKVGLKDEQKYARHGWEVVGFNDDAKRATKISGTVQRLDIESPAITLESKSDDKTGRIATGPIAGGYGINIETVGPNTAIDINSENTTEIRGGSATEGGILLLKNNVVKLQTGGSKVEMTDRYYSVSGFLMNQEIEMNGMGITIKHGDNSMVMDSSGISFAGNSLKILNPSVVIEDIESKIKAKAESVKRGLTKSAFLVEQKLTSELTKAIGTLKNTIDKVKSDVESKIRSDNSGNQSSQ